ncbi:oligopeptide/dipeptide ABC transporter ATP-binding protein C-terminal domain [Clostridium sp. CAG:58]|nr:oligopeptide/dipeptide ABC transporter ATP-binding protein C-terminal domain [Clostridium sp. CAG:58]
MEEKQVLVRIEDLCKYFRLSSKEELKAVDHVSFDIFRNETVGIVGESGCGKTTLGRTVLGLYPAPSGRSPRPRRAGSCLTGWTSTAPGNGKCANLKSAPRSCSRIPMHP